MSALALALALPINKIKQRKIDIYTYLYPLIPNTIVEIICSYDFTLTGESYIFHGFNNINWILHHSNNKNTESILIYGTKDMIQLFDLDIGRHFYTMQDCYDEQSCAVVLPTGDIVYGTTSGTIKIWNIDKKKSNYSKCIFKQHENKINNIFRFKTEKQIELIITCSDDKTVKFLDLKSGICEETIDFSHCVKYLCTLSENRFACVSNNNIYIRNIKFNKFDIFIQESNHEQIKCLNGLSNGNIITGTDKGRIMTWDTMTGSCQSVIQSHPQSIINVCVLPDQRIVSASHKILKVWNTITGKCEHTFDSHKEIISAICVLSDGRILSSTLNGEIFVWD